VGETVLWSLKSSLVTPPFLGTKDPSITTAEMGCLFTDLKQHCQQLDTSKALLMCWLGASPLRQGAHTTWHGSQTLSSSHVQTAAPNLPAPSVQLRTFPRAVAADHTMHVQQLCINCLQDVWQPGEQLHL